MAGTCHSYGLRNRSSLSKAAIYDSGQALSVNSAGDTSSVSTLHGRRDDSASRKKKDNKTTFVSLEETIVSIKRKTKGVKGAHRVGIGISAKVLDIEDTPPAVYRFEEEEAASIRSGLLSWYDSNHRTLPWRQNKGSRHQHCYGSKEMDNEKCNLEFEEQSDLEHYSTRIEVDSVAEKVVVESGSQSESMGGVSSEAADKKVEENLLDQRAYEVWVSEMMLQQTRVATVIEYYKRWMEKWPTVQHLAMASQEEVNTVWAGLGYYRRAKFLLEGAKQIVEKRSGRFPKSPAELQQVPGIGGYTAGAIASIAFQQPVPVVDGNVIRVLSRLRVIPDSPKLSSTVKMLWALAKELVDPERPGDLNQALMELGATVCAPTSPACSSCPISSHCNALSLQSKSVKLVTDFPMKVAKVPPRDEFVCTCVLVVDMTIVPKSYRARSSDPSSTYLLLVQRPKQGLLAGLWEFPLVTLSGVAVSAKERTSAMDRYLEDHLGFNLTEPSELIVKERQALGTYVHVFSHIRMHMSVEWLLFCPSEATKWELSMIEKRSSVPVKWVQAEAIGGIGLSTSVKKVHSMYLDHLKGQCEKPRTKRSKHGR